MAAAMSSCRSNFASGLNFSIITLLLPGTSSIAFRLCNFNPAIMGNALSAFPLLQHESVPRPPAGFAACEAKLSAEERRARYPDQCRRVPDPGRRAGGRRLPYGAPAERTRP